MRVLITGGAGFIGSNLARALVARGDRVVVADNLVSTHSLSLLGEAATAVEFVHADVRSPEDLERLPPGPFDRVYHLAASFANALSVEHPHLDMRTNVDGTSNVLAFALRAGCGLFVYTASSSSYGDAPPPFHEDGPMRPHTPYAMSKHLGELYVRESGLASAVFRLFNVYGPGDPPGPYRNAIPNMAVALDGPEGRIRLFGDLATRDFTFIGDVVEVLLDPEPARGRVVNVGTGVETRVGEVAARIVRLLDLPRERIVAEAPRRWDRVVRRCADVARLRELYGRVPATPLDEGLARTASWLSAAGHLKRPVR